MLQLQVHRKRFPFRLPLRHPTPSFPRGSMAVLLVFMFALSAFFTPEAHAVHHRNRSPPTPPPPPPPPPLVWPPPDVCRPWLDVCNHVDCGVPDTQGGFFTVWDYCCRPFVPPVASPMLSSAASATSSVADCGGTTGFPGLSSSAAAAGQGSSRKPAWSTATASAPAAWSECVSPLAGLGAACGAFLTKGDPETPAPQSKCCSQLVAFVNGSSTAADDDGHRDTLRCISPPVLKNVNKLLDAPLDPARIMYLPIQCGVVLPPESLYICLTGQRRPPLVSRIPATWENAV